MARFCITPIIGDGTMDNEYRAAIVAAADSVRALIPSEATGEPKYSFCACRFEAANMTPVAQVSNTYILPDYPLDGLLENMDPATRTAMVQSVEAYDIDGQGLHIDLSAFGDSSRFRDVIEHIAHVFEPLAWMDVPNA